MSNNEHIPKIERQIGTLKEQTRAIYCTLPFHNIPRCLIIKMLYAANYWLNMFPRKGRISQTMSLCDRIPTKKVPCLTPTLIDEVQAKNHNTTYNGYIMEFWKFALTWKPICPVQHKITQKEQKETTKEGGISLTIMGQRSIYNSIHKPQRSKTNH